MPHFKPWASSPEHAAAKKIVDDVGARLTAAKADLARMKPKLGAYKKETLERLIKENQVKLAAAEKLKTASASSPEGAYLKEINTQSAAMVKEIMKDVDKEVAQVKSEHQKEADAAMAYSKKGEGQGGSYTIAIALCAEYKNMIKALEDEAKRAGKEGTTQPRTI